MADKYSFIIYVKIQSFCTVAANMNLILSNYEKGDI